jgi:aminopeptidase
MIDAEAFAELICDWCLEVEAGQQVLISTTTLAQTLALAVHGALLRREAWPILDLEPPGIQAEFFRYAHERQIDSFPPVQLAMLEGIDASVRIEAPEGRDGLAGVEPDKQLRWAIARAPLQHALVSHRWALTIWPTPALAAEAGLAAGDYEAFVRSALFLDQPDPLECWRALRARQQKLVEQLTPARQVRIQTARTDITLDVTDRIWINSDGKRNMPSGEVFTGPHEHSANGTVYFDIPSEAGRVQGVELTFKDGEVVSAHADHGDQFLQSQLAADDGARFLGELGIGTNSGIDRATGSTLLDEKMAGTVHLALGRSYPETGGTNSSVVHWDLICDLRQGGRITVDGETLTENGTFTDVG